MEDYSEIPHTSNKIDEVIDFINDLPKTAVKAKWIVHLLEEIRDANGQIRDWGNLHYSKVWQLNEEINGL